MENIFEESANHIAERLAGVFCRHTHAPAVDTPYSLFKMTAASPQAARRVAGRIRELLPVEHRSLARVGAYTLLNNRVYFDQRSVFFSWQQLKDPARAKFILGRLALHSKDLQLLAAINPVKAPVTAKKPLDLAATLWSLWTTKAAVQGKTL